MSLRVGAKRTMTDIGQSRMPTLEIVEAHNVTENLKSTLIVESKYDICAFAAWCTTIRAECN